MSLHHTTYVDQTKLIDVYMSNIVGTDNAVIQLFPLPTAPKEIRLYHFGLTLSVGRVANSKSFSKLASQTFHLIAKLARTNKHWIGEPTTMATAHDKWIGRRNTNKTKVSNHNFTFNGQHHLVSLFPEIFAASIKSAGVATQARQAARAPRD